MFVELNEIKGVIFDLDGFYRTVDPPTPPPADDVSVQFLTDCVENLRNKNIPYLLISAHDPGLIVAALRTFMSHLKESDVITAQSEVEMLLVRYTIARALKKMSVKPAECVFVSPLPGRISQALDARLGTICVALDNLPDDAVREVLQYGPDFMVSSVKGFQDILSGKYIGYVGEVWASLKNIRRSGYAEMFQVRNIVVPGGIIYVTGRYFMTSDPRFKKHALSQKLIDLKNRPQRQAKTFAEIMARAARNFGGEDFDFITRVPPKPSRRDDQLLPALQAIPTVKLTRPILPEAIRPDLCKCVKDYPPQKQSSPTQRVVNVKDAFTVDVTCRGKCVVVFDDITTTGATLAEISRQFIAAGCAKVIPISISFHPPQLSVKDLHTLKCPTCQIDLVIRFNGQNGDLFWGCPNYHSQPQCKQSKFFRDGVIELNALNGSELEEEIIIEDDISF